MVLPLIGWDMETNQWHRRTGKRDRVRRRPELQYGRRGYYAPDANGFMAGGNPNADRVTWWATEQPNVTPWPTDFVPQVLNTLDSTPRYYIQGVVTSQFSVARVLNQIYERHIYDELIQAKYGGSGKTPYIRWINNAVSKLTSQSMPTGLSPSPILRDGTGGS
jgi:hypothetical protein